MASTKRRKKVHRAAASPSAAEIGALKRQLEDVAPPGQQVVVVRNQGASLSGALTQLVAPFMEMATNVASNVVGQYASTDTHPEDWDWAALGDLLIKNFNLRFQVNDEDKHGLKPEQLEQQVVDAVLAVYEQKEQQFGAPILRHLEKLVLLQTLDALWKDHLLSMDHLKEGIGLRGYGQKNPLQEYKKEGFEMFEAMMGQFDADVVERVFTVQIARQEDVQQMEQQRRPQAQMTMSGGGAAPQPVRTKPKTAQAEEKIGRNDPCPCGSGKKYKKCHGT